MAYRRRVGDPSRRDYSVVTDPSWIEYADAQLSDRTRFERTLTGCEMLWDETRDNMIVGVALAWTDVHCQFLRPWLQKAVQATLMRNLPASVRTASETCVFDLLPPEHQDWFKAVMFKKGH